jgi:hypothetical protein
MGVFISRSSFQTCAPHWGQLDQPGCKAVPQLEQKWAATVLCATGKIAGVEGFPLRVKAHTSRTIRAIGRPITSTIASNPKPNMKVLPNIMANISFQPLFDDWYFMPVSLCLSASFSGFTHRPFGAYITIFLLVLNINYKYDIIYRNYRL